MMTPLQEIFNQLRESGNNQSWNWNGSLNEWYKKLSATYKGQITERFAAIITNGAVMDNNRSGYAVRAADKRIEVKAAIASFDSRGYQTLKWGSIRPNDPYTHILFIAIYPYQIRAFLVDRARMPDGDLKPDSSDRTNSGYYQIIKRVSRTTNLPVWMTSCEIIP